MPDWGHRLERVTRNLKPSTYRKICAVALFLLGAIVVTGGAVLNWGIAFMMLVAGFLSAWPYNYWRLKKYNEACH